ncbi:hypothetical protein LTR08_004104 [Meristemomyces frigidus]|nr:hypothetical protein LTR08_004104 [Meristemomyces frigidus]
MSQADPSGNASHEQNSHDPSPLEDYQLELIRFQQAKWATLASSPTVADTVASPAPLSPASPDTLVGDTPTDVYSWPDGTDDRIHVFYPVARIMEAALPENARISRDASECMQECISEFISFVTGEAAEKCQQERRLCLDGEDVLYALCTLGFENYYEAMKIYLARYREDAEMDVSPDADPGEGAGVRTRGYEAAGNAVENVDGSRDASVYGSGERSALEQCAHGLS